MSYSSPHVAHLEPLSFQCPILAHMLHTWSLCPSNDLAHMLHTWSLCPSNDLAHMLHTWSLCPSNDLAHMLHTWSLCPSNDLAHMLHTWSLCPSNDLAHMLHTWSLCPSNDLAHMLHISYVKKHSGERMLFHHVIRLSKVVIQSDQTTSWHFQSSTFLPFPYNQDLVVSAQRASCQLAPHPRGLTGWLITF